VITPVIELTPGSAKDLIPTLLVTDAGLRP
jgi:hypothetical protein